MGDDRLHERIGPSERHVDTDCLASFKSVEHGLVVGSYPNVVDRDPLWLLNQVDDGGAVYRS